MIDQEALRKRAVEQLQGAMALEVAFIGVANGLFSALSRLGQATPAALAHAAGVDAGYVLRWCDVAYAFGYLDERGADLVLTQLGDAFRPEVPGTLSPFSVQAVLSAHMAERAASLMPSGERPGESVLAERATILRWFGPMLEGTFGGLFEREIMSQLEVFADVDARSGLVVDLGCGNGWILRRLAARFTRLRGLGIDAFEVTVRQAEELARAQGLGDRLCFRAGELLEVLAESDADLVTMSRALHHVWHDRDRLFSSIACRLREGGAVVVWEPAWPDERAPLSDPSRRGMAFQNLAEHVQGNRFLGPAEIEEALRGAGLHPRTHLFAGGNEAVVVATKP